MGGHSGFARVTEAPIARLAGAGAGCLSAAAAAPLRFVESPGMLESAMDGAATSGHIWSLSSLPSSFGGSQLSGELSFAASFMERRSDKHRSLPITGNRAWRTRGKSLSRSLGYLGLAIRNPMYPMSASSLSHIISQCLFYWCSLQHRQQGCACTDPFCSEEEPQSVQACSGPRLRGQQSVRGGAAGGSCGGHLMCSSTPQQHLSPTACREGCDRAAA